MNIVDMLLSPAFIGMALTAIAGVLVAVKVLNDKRKQYVFTAINIAYNAVNNVVALREKKGEAGALDKAAEGLKIINEWMKSNGWAPLSAKEETVAKIGFDAMHGAASEKK